jgi:pimeloyl-ACP methyl ester carboxylesterase
VLERNGVRVYYEDHGEGISILLTHGYAASSRMWQGQVEAFSGDYRLITWDQRGHGQSDSPEDLSEYGESVALDDMAALLDTCGIERAVIGGHSLGGYLSLAFLLKYPERVRALVLLGAGPGYRSDEAREGWNQYCEERAQAFDDKGLDALGKGTEVQDARHRSAEGLARAARGTMKQVDARVMDSLKGIVTPTLVVVGEKDRTFLAASDYMAKKIPSAVRVVIEDAGHAANMHQPEAFNAALRTFLTGRLRKR